MTVSETESFRRSGALRGERSAARSRALAQNSILNKIFSSWFWLAALGLACVLMLSPAFELPIGGYYWDVFLYPDAAWRIANGQIPHVDFFTPAGAWQYYSYALLHSIFPNGHFILLSNWSVLLVTMPLMAWINREVAARGRLIAFMVVLPFVFFSFLPLNSKEVYPFAGLDGFGIYNRHICLLLYVLVAAFVFIEPGRKLTFIAAIVFTATFFTKITGAAVALVIIMHAILAGRLHLRQALQIAAIFLTMCGVLEIYAGLISAYLRDIAILIDLNDDSMIGRLRNPVIMYFDTFGTLIVLAAMLAWMERTNIAALLSIHNGLNLKSRIATLFNHDAAWIMMLAITGVMFETQNTGSLAFIFVWPFLIDLAWRWHGGLRNYRTAILILIAVCIFPTIVPMLQRTFRVTLGAMFYDSINLPSLKGYGAVEARSELLTRAHAMKSYYSGVEDRFIGLAKENHQPSYLLFSEFDFQIMHQITIAEAKDALFEWEAKNNTRLNRLIVLDFADVFTPLLQREPVKLISIGMAAERTVPPLDSHRLSHAMQAGALLVPQCPITPTRLSLFRTFEPVLAGRKRVSLTPCWDMFVKT